jgi:hypothetical protein
MADADSRIEGHLYEGESVQHRLNVGETRVVVTDNRVFVSTPGESGIRHAERPNVAAVEPAVTGSRWSLQIGLSLLVVALPLLVAGGLVRQRFGGIDLPQFDEETADTIGAGGLTDLVELLLYLANNLDLVLLGIGGTVLGVAVVAVLWYVLRARVPTFAIRLAGETSDIHIPRDDAPEDICARLERLIIGTTVAASGTPGGDTALADASPEESLPGPEDSPPELDDQERPQLPEPDKSNDTDDDSDTGLF